MWAMPENQHVAVILIGIQASGKTTFYHQYLKDSCEHVSLDLLHTRNKERQAIHGCISRQSNFAVDNTNPTKEDRHRYILAAKEAEYSVIGCFFRSRVSECIVRNAQREGKAKVADVAVFSTSNKLELPSLAEGFDQLYYISIVQDGGFNIEQWRNDCEIQRL